MNEDSPTKKFLTMRDTLRASELRTLALAGGEPAFAHMVTAALESDDQWAVDRVKEALVRIDQLERVESSSPALARVSRGDAVKLRVISSTDATRPDGAAAKSLGGI